MRPRPFPLRLALVLALALAAADARAAPSGGVPRLAATVEALFLQPAGADTRGFGAGLQIGYRLTDQLSLTADGGQLDSRAGLFHSFAGGVRALLDSTPVAPFVGLSLARLGPRPVTGMGLAIRSSVGADWKIAAPLSLGIEVRTLTPVGSDSSGLVGGTGIALRLVFLPALLR